MSARRRCSAPATWRAGSIRTSLSSRSRRASTPATPPSIIGRYDIVADGSDNAETRYLVSDACYFAKRTLVFGAVGPFDGYVSTFKPHERDADGTPYPSYRCLFPEAPPPGTIPNCAEVGVLGAVVGVIGTLQATEVLKEILGIGHEPGRASADVRRARRALRDAFDRLRCGKSDQWQQPVDNRPFNPLEEESQLDMRRMRG